MDNPIIKIRRTKEELRKYNVFSAIEMRPIRRMFQYAGPILGIMQLVIYYFWVQSTANLLIGAFLAIYPFLTRYSIIRASDQSYDRNNLGDYELTVSFNEDSFISETDVVCQKFMYRDVYKVYNRKDDLIVFLDKYSGLYISKKPYEKETIDNIVKLLIDAIPEKF